MANVYHCDLCQNSAKQTTCSQVTVSKKGKEVKTLDACPSCTKSILTGKLNTATARAKKSNFLDDPVLKESFSPSKFGNYGKPLTNIDENDKLLEEKLGPGVLNIPSQAGRTSGGKIETVSPATTNATSDGVERCPHYNKKRAGNIEKPYFKCSDCGEKLEFKDWESSKKIT